MTEWVARPDAFVSMMLGRSIPILWLTALLCAGCSELGGEIHPALPAMVQQAQDQDYDLQVCQRRIAETKALPGLPGTPKFDAKRAQILGRAVGEPALFVSPPQSALDRELPSQLVKTRQGVANHSPRRRVGSLLSRLRGQPQALRRLLLREGYVYSELPYEAYGLVNDVTLPKLFNEPQIWLQRGEQVHRLDRHRARWGRGFEYRYANGPSQGLTAKLLFADRVVTDRSALGLPLHRDVRSFRDRAGFDRMRVLHRTDRALLAKLRFGDRWVTALVSAAGARLELQCLDAPLSIRREVAGFRAADAPRQRALRALRQAVGAMVVEALPFDRPRGVKDHLSDGQLRHQWNAAYRRGSTSFSYDDEGYVVFDLQGRPMPPQMCVEMILDAYERASGTWYQRQGEPRKRLTGGLDFRDLGVVNRAGVMGIETYAKSKPELFEASRFAPAERIRFKERDRFFAYLVDHADRFRPGDIIAIQGPKPDGYVHQHAILIEDVDPLTGFPNALVDQMKRPRRRTFERIMAEAPLRSLLYHLRPKPSLLLRLDPQRRSGPATTMVSAVDGLK
jgi:hypothetical protein